MKTTSRNLAVNVKFSHWYLSNFILRFMLKLHLILVYRHADRDTMLPESQNRIQDILRYT